MARRVLAVAAAYLGLAVLWAAPASLRPARAVPDLGDPLHLAWVMAWDAHQLVRHPLALFDANGFYPYPASLTFADHLLPEALLVAPVRWLGGNDVLAFNLSVLAALTLSALSMFLLVRRLTGSDGAAFLAGAAYAFNSFTLHELPRVHVLSLQWWPLAWLFLDRFVAGGGRARDAALAAAALALQGLSGTYYLAYTLLLLPLWVAVVFLAHRQRLTLAYARRLTIALAVAALPVLAMLAPYLRQLRALGIEKGWAGGADLLAYVDPGPRNWLWGWLDNPALESELPHFLGVMGLLLLALGAARVLAGRTDARAGGGAALALVTAAAGVLLSLGPIVNVGGRRVGLGFYELLYRLVPPARAMASPERSGALVLLGGAVLVGLAVAAVLERVMERQRWAIVMGLALLLPLEHWGPPRAASEVPAGAAVPAVYRWLATQPSQPLVELPLYPERQRKQWSLYLHFSTAHWRRIPIGRASFYPPVHDLLAWSLRGFPDRTSLAALDRLGLRTVVVHPRLWPEDERGLRVRELDAHPRLRLLRTFAEEGGAAQALGLGGERVYALLSGPPPDPPCQPVEEIPPAAWALSSTGVNKPARAVDGDAARAWFTAQPQRPGDHIQVTLPAPETVAAVAVRMHYPYEEFGRNLVLVAKGESGGWQRVPYDDGPEERWALLRDLVQRPTQALMVLRLAPRRVSALRLMVGYREEEPAWPRWSVPELMLFRRCQAAAP
jgi:hypothetical protein